ncbi:unnamed protein product [Choristocarpus tenellus]
MLAPDVLAKQNREMKLRLTASSLVLGSLTPNDWTLSSTQPQPSVGESWGPDQTKKNSEMKKALQTAQIVLGSDDPDKNKLSSNTMPVPERDLSTYRGKLNEETARLIRQSSLKLGSDKLQLEHKTSVAQDGMCPPDKKETSDMFVANRNLFQRLQQRGELTCLAPTPDGKESANLLAYGRSNQMPDLTNHMRKARPDMTPELQLRIRQSNISFGDNRIKTLTSIQNDSLDHVVQATQRLAPGTQVRGSPNPTKPTIVLGDKQQNDWSTSNAMPDWYAPETYNCTTTSYG